MRKTIQWAAAGLAGVSAAAWGQSLQGEVESVLTEAGAVSARELATGLEHPWGMAFLPDGRLLVTERAGRLRILATDHSLSDPVQGVPEVWANGQGGLLDVALDPDFQTNQLVYLSYAKPGPDGAAASALGRGRLVDDRIEGFEDIFVQEPWIRGPNHFGGRIVFCGPDLLFLTLGERFQFDPAQDNSNHLGTVVRIHTDGSIPDDNPFAETGDGAAEIWSFGHRNILAAAIDPATGKLWIAEMGPLGGDELNQPEAGRNYGWPVVSWGLHYDGRDIPDPEPDDGRFADAVRVWSPVISPSGMIFYTGDGFPEWRGSAIIGGLSAHDLVRITIEDGQVTGEERVPLPDRIRDVEQGPDGMVYVLTDRSDGSVWRLQPLP